jgi:hypothetical protein
MPGLVGTLLIAFGLGGFAAFVSALLRFGKPWEGSDPKYARWQFGCSMLVLVGQIAIAVFGLWLLLA